MGCSVCRHVRRTGYVTLRPPCHSAAAAAVCARAPHSRPHSPHPRPPPLSTPSRPKRDACERTRRRGRRGKIEFYTHEAAAVGETVTTAAARKVAGGSSFVYQSVTQLSRWASRDSRRADDYMSGKVLCRRAPHPERTRYTRPQAANWELLQYLSDGTAHEKYLSLAALDGR
ncbi:hypothetical protein EVAR_78277_1 [Eumeta japonica]|uniref:Uncharacterized protein n=1 Tax=Eumeta variegata TaxID=151549 RepID=A0A4C1T3X9_EUMVA|nr:hypothetical protein EVAR_78277_1 [Eumeta japonica]